jgi:dUTP pyrophosphatase
MVANKVTVRFKKLHPDAKMPVHASDHAAAFDLHSLDEHTLMAGEVKAIETGIAMEIPEGKCVQFWDRSGMGFKGIHRFAGLIDSDYRGEFKVILCNHTKGPFAIQKGDRIVQGLMVDHYHVEFEEVMELSDTSRGEGGFGSTGMQ